MAKNIVCVMIVNDQFDKIQKAIKNFRDQTYPHKQLIIVNDNINRKVTSDSSYRNVKTINLSRRFPDEIQLQIGYEYMEKFSDINIEWDKDVKYDNLFLQEKLVGEAS